MCKNYYPISLANLDNNILAKILAARLLKVVVKLMHTDQTCFLKKQYSSDNTGKDEGNYLIPYTIQRNSLSPLHSAQLMLKQPLTASNGHLCSVLCRNMDLASTSSGGLKWPLLQTQTVLQNKTKQKEGCGSTSTRERTVLEWYMEKCKAMFLLYKKQRHFKNT